MEITTETYSAHEKLSACSAKFLDFVKKNPGNVVRSNFNSILSNNQLSDMPLQPWPTFINKNTKKEIAEAAVKVFNLIKSIPERFFAMDFNKIGQYYEISKEWAELIYYKVDDEYIRHLLGRGDFVFSSSGLKCIEYNIVGNLGGWELDILEQLYINNSLISEFLRENSITVHSNRLFEVLFEYLINRILTKGIDNNSPWEINTALVFPLARPEDRSGEAAELYFSGLYKKILKQKNAALEGEIMMCGMPQLEVADDFIFYKGKKIHTMIELCNGEVPMKVKHVVDKGNMFLYNGPISLLMSNKLNLALLSEHEDSDVFSLQERRIIKEHIPWTRKIIPCKTRYGDMEITFPDFILSNKDRLVIKPSVGLGGDQVYVGRHVTGEQWNMLVQKALKNKNWVIQEYVESLPYLYQAGERGCVEHRVVWGFFVFGSLYAGATVRLLPWKDDRGVINVHQGAEKSIVIEVEE